MDNKSFKQRLRDLGACQDAINWLGDRTAQECLEQCHRGDWLLWWFFREKSTEGFPDIKQITKAKVECVRLVSHLMQDERSKIALNVAWSWANDETTDEELSIAKAGAFQAQRDAAYAADAADAAYAYAYAYAAYAADAAYAAYAAAYAADAAAYAAAYAYAYAADAADAYAYAADAGRNARKATLLLCADICRTYLKLPDNY